MSTNLSDPDQARLDALADTIVLAAMTGGTPVISQGAALWVQDALFPHGEENFFAALDAAAKRAGLDGVDAVEFTGIGVALPDGGVLFTDLSGNISIVEPDPENPRFTTYAEDEPYTPAA